MENAHRPGMSPSSSPSRSSSQPSARTDGGRAPSTGLRLPADLELLDLYEFMASMLATFDLDELEIHLSDDALPLPTPVYAGDELVLDDADSPTTVSDFVFFSSSPGPARPVAADGDSDDEDDAADRLRGLPSPPTDPPTDSCVRQQQPFELVAAPPPEEELQQESETLEDAPPMDEQRE